MACPGLVRYLVVPINPGTAIAAERQERVMAGRMRRVVLSRRKWKLIGQTALHVNTEHSFFISKDQRIGLRKSTNADVNSTIFKVPDKVEVSRTRGLEASSQDRHCPDIKPQL